MLHRTPNFGAGGAELLSDPCSTDDHRSVVAQQAHDAPEARVGGAVRLDIHASWRCANQLPVSSSQLSVAVSKPVVRFRGLSCTKAKLDQYFTLKNLISGRRTGLKLATGYRPLTTGSLPRMPAGDAFGKVAESFVNHCVGPARVIPGGDLLLAAAADQHHLVADRRARDPRYIHQGQVHRDTAYDGRALAAQQHLAATSRGFRSTGRSDGNFPRQAVAVPNRNHGYARRRRRDVSASVSQRLASRHIAQAEDMRLPR